MKNKNILVITDNQDISEKLASKLFLLRAADTFVVSDYENFHKKLKKNNFKVVILHEGKNKELTKEAVKLVKSEEFSPPVILIPNELDYDFILNSYDIGIYDYFLMSANPAEILIKVVNAIKLFEVSEKSKKNSIILKQLGYISNQDFYTEKCGQEIIENELEKLINSDGSFIILTCDESDKKKFDKEKMSYAIKNSLRQNDAAVELKSGKYYILLGDTEFLDAVVVINKIKNKIDESFQIRAGVTMIKNRSFAELEKKASSALTDAMLNSLDYVCFDEENNDENIWLDGIEKSKKDYKLFKQAFNKKLEKVITPVFFRLQSCYEEKLQKTKIDQYTDDIQSIFSLKSENLNSKLKIIYPGLGKVVMVVTHEGLDSPENREMKLPLNQITQKELTIILEDFIKEHRDYIEN